MRFIYQNNHNRLKFYFRIDSDEELRQLEKINPDSYYWIDEGPVLSTDIVAKALGVECNYSTAFTDHSDESLAILRRANLDISKLEDRKQLVNSVSNYLSTCLSVDREEHIIFMNKGIPEVNIPSIDLNTEQSIFFSLGNKIYEAKVVAENKTLESYLKRRISLRVKRLKREMASVLLAFKDEYERKINEIKEKYKNMLEFPDFTLRDIFKGYLIWRYDNRIVVAKPVKFSVTKLIVSGNLYELKDEYVQEMDAVLIFYLAKEEDGYQIVDIRTVEREGFFVRHSFVGIKHPNISLEGSTCLGDSDNVRGVIVSSIKDLYPYFDRVVEILETANDDSRYKRVEWIERIKRMINDGDSSFAKEATNLDKTWSV